MVAELRIDVNSVMRELDLALGLLTESRIVSRYRKIFKGKGMEFEDFRHYTPEDDASRIDWRASKRVNKLLIRRFKEERDMNVFFMVDVSSSMLFGSTEKLKHEYAAELVAALSHFVLESGDRIGLVLFKDKVVKYLEPGKSEGHYFVLLRHLLTPEFYGGKYNLSKALNFLANIVTERSIVFVVSDFIGMEPNWGKALLASTGMLDGIGIMVRDPRDWKLPPEAGQVVISDPFSNRVVLVDCGDEKARLEYENLVQKEAGMIRETFKKSMWDLLEVSTDEGFVTPILKFLKRREILFR